MRKSVEQVEKIEQAEPKTRKAEKRKTGEWIIDKEHKTCSACGAVMLGWAYREPFKFCPKCGSQNLND